MKKRILPAVITGLCVLLFSVVHAQGPGPAVNISRFQVQPGALATKLVMETDGLLRVQRACYLAESPQTLVLDLAGAQTASAPIIPSSEAGFIRDIQVQKSGAQDLRLLVRLSERVPVRVLAEAGRTTIELNRIQRAQGAYLIDAATQSELDRRAKSEILLSKLDTTAGAESVSVKANLTGPAISQVFALENPPGWSSTSSTPSLPPSPMSGRSTIPVQRSRESGSPNSRAPLRGRSPVWSSTSKKRGFTPWIPARTGSSFRFIRPPRPA